MTSLDPRTIVYRLISGIIPQDERESRDRTTALERIDSGAPLFRIARPATPDPHLCVYTVPLDDARRTVSPTDHVKARCRLAPGGHVDPDEDPRTTALREAHEELGIDGTFHPRFGSAPLFESVTATRGEH
ncbi:NUDIX hydrolase [Nocardia asiatica]|uniref:NUDIX hydrolase n=1 Tax=Nocardia asiatica TaxID=209252 RepID=UPI002455BB77|nr:NUDIX hydrolase [Nocardia asiatica]